MTSNRIRSVLYRVFTFACLLGLYSSAHAQTAMVQVPFTSVALGVPASTYNGTSASACSASTPGYLNSLGDGCPPTQATLISPYGVATDSLDNLYVADEGDSRIRVVYHAGANLAAALVAANPGYSFTPTPGTVYSFGGLSALIKATSGVYYCNGTSGTIAYDSYGDGCPAQYAFVDQPRDVVVDQYGNIFFPEAGNRIVVIYVAGSAVSSMITTYNNAITNPLPGYIYLLDAPGDFSTKTSIAVDLNENLYVGDTNALTPTPTGDTTQASTYGDQVKKFTGTGWVTYVSSSGYVAKTDLNGDGGPVASGIIQNPNSIVCDAYGNLYIAETRIRIVYNGGPTPPLYLESSATTVTPVTNPQKGNIYTVGGGYASTGGHVTGTLAADVYANGSVKAIGVDPSGNVYFANGAYHEIWRIDQATGIGFVLAGSGASTTTGSASAAPTAGAACNGTTGGPLMTDAYADGCPATEVAFVGGIGGIAFDSMGNFYYSEQRANTAEPIAIIRKYSFANRFSPQAAGTTSTVPLAFTPGSSATYTPSPSAALSLTGDSTGEFADAGGDLCSITAGDEGASPQTCVYNVSFKPASVGQHSGSISATSSGAVLGSAFLGGVGTGAQLSLDPATQTIIGSGLAPSGVAADQGGNLFIADATTGNIYKSAAGAPPVQLATGFSQSAQIAVDGAGNVYVADAGNNRVAMINASGVSTLLSTYNSIPLSGPTGVAADAAGNIYVSDTGNNRVIQVTPLGNALTEPFTGLASPRGIAIDPAGDLFVADSGNARVVELTAAGVQSAITVSPALVTPVGVALDPAGDLYIADSGNLNVVEVPAGSSTSTVLIGDTAGINGLAADNGGDVFVAASSIAGAVELNRTNITVPYLSTNVGQTEAQALTLSNTGNASLNIGSALSSSTDATNFAIGAAATNGCAISGTLTVGQNCALNAVFQPQSVAPFQDTVTFPSNAVNAATALLTGSGVNSVSSATAISYVTPAGGVPLSGQSFTVTAAVTPGASGPAMTGTVTFTIDNGPTTTVPVGSGTATLPLTLQTGAHTISAVYSGDANYASSWSDLSVTAVVPAATSLALAVSSAGPPENTVPFTVTASLTSLAVQGGMTGHVTFVVDGGAPTDIPVANNAASITLTLPYGPHTVDATYSGDSYYLTSSNTLPVSVVANGTSSTALSITSPTGTIAYGESIVVATTITTGNATGTPTGTVTFAIDGTTLSTVPYAATLSVTLNPPAAGSHSLTATYSGDHNYAPSTGTLVINVARATPVVTISVTPNVYLSSNNFTITATVSSVYATPTGTVNISTASGALGTITLTNGTGSYTTTTNVLGNYVFTGSYSGDVNFVPTTASITPAPTFILSAAQSSASMPQGGVATYSININSFYGYTGSVTFSCTGLPASSVCGAYPPISTVPADAIQNVQIQVVTNVSSTLAGIAPWSPQRKSWCIAAMAFSLLLAWSLWMRRHRLGGISLALLMLIAVLGATGCGSDTRQTATYTTPVGTYTVVVSGTDGQTTSSSTVTLTIVQAQ